MSFNSAYAVLWLDSYLISEICRRNLSYHVTRRLTYEYYYQSRLEPPIYQTRHYRIRKKDQLTKM